MKQNKTRKEIIYLYVIQITNMAIPFVTLPFLTHTLGAEYYGKLSYAQAVSMIYVFLVDFGFNFSAARAIGVNKDKPEFINAVYTNVQVIKLFLFLLLLFLSMLFYYIHGGDTVDNNLFMVGSISSLGSIFVSSWVFQGLGINSILAIINLFFRLISLCLIFIYIKVRDDVVLAAFLMLMPLIVVGITVQLFFLKRGVVFFSIKLINFNFIKKLFLESYHNFSASLLTLGFTYFNIYLVMLL